MGNGYFYTLSAIAQSFAAIVSLYAIFAIYKLQILKNEKNELIDRLKNIMVNKKIERTKLTSKDRLAEMIKSEFFGMQLEDLLALSKKGYRSDTEKITTAIEKLSESPKKIKKLLKYALIMNGITIAYSLIFLPYKINSKYILFGAIGLAIITLFYTIIATWLTISEYSE